MTTRGHIHIALQVCIITALAVLFSRTVIYSITSIPTFNSSISGGDFKMSDIYNSVVNSNNDVRRSKSIAIIGVDDCSRMEIAKVINAVNDCGPAAVGLDIMFPWQYAEDSILITAISNCSNIVLPCKAIYENRVSSFTDVTGSYFYDDSFQHYGIVNFWSQSINSTVREFKPFFDINGKNYNSMAAELVSIASLDRYLELKSLENHKHIIFYPSVDFEQMTANELLSDKESAAKVLDGKIVFIGDINDGHDFHITPIDKAMPGVKIHAYTTETILNGQYIRTTSSFFNWALAILTCMIFISLNFVSRYKFPTIGKIILRLLQIGCLYAFYILGCHIFENRQLYIDFIPALTMMALGLFAYDVWVGGVVLVKKIVVLISKGK